MSITQISSLSLKIAGIYSIIQALPLMQHLLTPFAMQSDEMPYLNFLFIGAILPILLLLTLGFCLIFFSDKLTKRMNFGNESSITAGVSLKDIQVMAFSIVGIIMIVLAIPKLVQIGVNINALKQIGNEAPLKRITISTWAYTIGLLVQLIFGLLLFFGAKGLSALWYYLQQFRPMSKFNNSDNQNLKT